MPVEPTSFTFYAELRPIGEHFDPAALAVSGLDRDQLGLHGEEPLDAMNRFRVWVSTIGEHFGAKPVFAAYPLGFDWMFAYWYLMRFGGESPFGHSTCIDMKSVYATKARLPYSRVGKRSMPQELVSNRRHTHNALDDAVEQADLLANLFSWKGRDLHEPD